MACTDEKQTPVIGESYEATKTDTTLAVPSPEEGVCLQEDTKATRPVFSDGCSEPAGTDTWEDVLHSELYALPSFIPPDASRTAVSVESSDLSRDACVNAGSDEVTEKPGKIDTESDAYNLSCTMTPGKELDTSPRSQQDAEFCNVINDQVELRELDEEHQERNATGTNDCDALQHEMSHLYTNILKVVNELGTETLGTSLSYVISNQGERDSENKDTCNVVNNYNRTDNLNDRKETERNLCDPVNSQQEWNYSKSDDHDNDVVNEGDDTQSMDGDRYDTTTTQREKVSSKRGNAEIDPSSTETKRGNSALSTDEHYAEENFSSGGTTVVIEFSGHKVGPDVQKSESPVLYNPRDGGWAWVILIATTLTGFVVEGLLRIFGVLFLALENRLSSTASEVSLLGSVSSGMYTVTAFVCVSLLTRLVSVRQLVVAGGVVGCCGLAASFLATTLSHLLLSFSVCLGVGMALAYASCFVLINAYFHRNLRIAIAVVTTGTAVGGIVMPLAIELLLLRYGHSGTFLILSGIFGQLLVFGSLMTPPSDYKPRKGQKTYMGVSYGAENKAREAGKGRKKVSVSSDHRGNNKTSVFNGHHGKNKNTSTTKTTDLVQGNQQTKADSNCCSATVRQKLRELFKSSLVRSAVFWLLAAYNYMGCVQCSLPSAFLPQLAQEKGLSPTEGALLVTIAAILDVCSRVICGLLAQFQLIKPVTSVTVAQLVLGCLFQLTHWMNGMLALSLTSAVYGCFSGVFFYTMALIIHQFCGSEKFATVFGVAQFASGVSGVTGFFLVGRLRDISGTYETAFHFMGCCGLVAFVLLCLLPSVKAWERRHEKTPQQDVKICDRIECHRMRQNSLN